MDRALRDCRAVLVDLGGTLVEPLREPADVFAAALGDRGVRIPYDVLRRAQHAAYERHAAVLYARPGSSGSLFRAMHREVLDEVGFRGPVDAVLDRLDEQFVSPRWHRPYPESTTFLTSLRSAGRPVHLVTNNFDSVVTLVDRLGWSDLVRSITYSQEVGAEKPAPAIFRRALERAGVAAAQAIHVGDSVRADVGGARAAGIVPVWVNRSGAPRLRNCRTVRDLSELLRRLGGTASVEHGRRRSEPLSGPDGRTGA